MSKKLIRGVILVLSMAFLSGCSGKKEEEPPQEELLMLEDHSVPVTISGQEIIVGKSALQSVLDTGLSVVLSEWDGSQVIQHEIDPNEILPAGTSATEISFWITDYAFARVSVEGTDKDMRIGDAVITRLALHLSHQPGTLPDHVLIDGVAVTEISRAKASEMFPDFDQEDLSVTQQGEDYRCTLMFSPNTYALYQFSLVKGEKEESILPPSTIW